MACLNDLSAENMMTNLRSAGKLLFFAVSHVCSLFILLFIPVVKSDSLCGGKKLSGTQIYANCAPATLHLSNWERVVSK